MPRPLVSYRHWLNIITIARVLNGAFFLQLKRNRVIYIPKKQRCVKFTVAISKPRRTNTSKHKTSAIAAANKEWAAAQPVGLLTKGGSAAEEAQACAYFFNNADRLAFVKSLRASAKGTNNRAYCAHTHTR